jgi:hypothetical protein
MVDTGVVAREMIVFMTPERRRIPQRRRVSPPTAAVHHPNSFCPVAPCFAQPRRSHGARFLFAFLARARSLLRSAVFPVSAFAKPQNGLRNMITSNSFLKLPPRPQWGHSSTTRRGEDIPFFAMDGERDTGESLSFTKRWPRGRGGYLCLL